MTNPVPLGAPDYARLAPFSDQVFIHVTGVNANVNATIFQNYAGNVRSIWFGVTIHGDDGFLSIQWSDDPTFFTVIGEHLVDIFQDKQLQHTMRPFAPYVRMIIVSNGGGAFTYDAAATTSPDTPIPLTSSGVNEIIQSPGVPVGAASSLVLNGAIGWIGLLYWNAFASGTNWTAELHRTDRLGVIHIVDMVDNTCIKGEMRQVPFIGGVPSVKITNFAAAGITANVFVLGGPAY